MESRLDELLAGYVPIMKHAHAIAITERLYDNTESIAAAIIVKAEFEARPVGLYSHLWRTELSAARAAGKDDGWKANFRNPAWVTQWVTGKTEPALRNTVSLQRRGELRERGTGTYEVAVTAVPRSGVETGIHADVHSGHRHLFVRLLIDEESGKAVAAPELQATTVAEAQLQYRTNPRQARWKTAGTLVVDPPEAGGARYVEFRIPLEPMTQIGLLEATVKVGGTVYALPPYAYAAPDNVDLREMIAESSALAAAEGTN